MNLNDEGRQEFANLRRSAPWWVRGLAPLWVAHHRGRRLVHGLYERSPLEYRIYTPAHRSSVVLRGREVDADLA